MNLTRNTTLETTPATSDPHVDEAALACSNSHRLNREHGVLQNLRIMFRAIQAHAKKVEQACGLSSAKLWMLHVVAAQPGIRVSRLAAALSIHPSTCSNMLDKLEDKNLVTRDRSKTDQRTVHLHITETGRELLAKAPSPPQGRLNIALQALSDEQLERLDAGLTDLSNALHVDDSRAGLIPISGE
jgi:DNA-binding MarR family transcriptional regulator